MNIRFLPPEVDAWIAARQTPPRSEGRHVSDIVLEMLKAIHRRYALLEKRGPGAQAIYEPGYLWEDTLSAALVGRVVTVPHERLCVQVELGRDGVFGTPDRVLYDTKAERWIVEESKCTWMSSRGLDEDPKALFDNVKFSYWFCQVKTYAALLLEHAVGWPYDAGHLVPVNVQTMPAAARGGIPAQPPLIRIRSLHLNGPYQFGGGDFPKPLAWEIEHTAEELATWWASILRFEERRVETSNGRPESGPAAPDDPARN